MRRMWMLVLALMLVPAVDLDAQQRCRRHGNVTICERDRDRDRDRDRGRGRRWYAPIEFGIRGGYDFDEDVGSAGAQFRIPLARPVLLSPSADVFFDDSETEWQINLDALLKPETLAGLYFGAGAAFVNRDFEDVDDAETEVGFNLLVGLDGGRIGGSSIRPFAEGRWTDVEDYDAFRLVVGINVPVSGRGW